MFEILVLVFVAIAGGFFLIFLAALTEKRRPSRTASSERSLTLQELEKVCLALAEKMKLEVEAIHRSGDQTIDMIAQNLTPLTGGTYILHATLSGSDEVIGAAEILELSNLVVQERASKGIFITTGRFTTDLPGIAELAPMEFVDGKRLQGLVDYRVILS